MPFTRLAFARAADPVGWIKQPQRGCESTKAVFGREAAFLVDSALRALIHPTAGERAERV